MAQAYCDKNDEFETFVAFGANVALGRQSLSEAIIVAISALDRPTCRLLRQSRMFHTPCFPAGAGPDYVNAVAAFRTTLTPRDVLALLHGVESDMGRERAQRWGSRTMDLDLLAYGNLVLPDPVTFWHWHDLAADQQSLRAPDTLIVPHPRVSERAFVLIPMLDIAPDWRHPLLGKTTAQMAAALPMAEKRAVRPLST